MCSLVQCLLWVSFNNTLSSSGLSNESWSIMKNMATELCIILIGYFTLVPAIQVTNTYKKFGHTYSFKFVLCFTSVGYIVEYSDNIKTTG